MRDEFYLGILRKAIAATGRYSEVPEWIAVARRRMGELEAEVERLRARNAALTELLGGTLPCLKALADNFPDDAGEIEEVVERVEDALAGSLDARTRAERRVLEAAKQHADAAVEEEDAYIEEEDAYIASQAPCELGEIKKITARHDAACRQCAATLAAYRAAKAEKDKEGRAEVERLRARDCCAGCRHNVPVNGGHDYDRRCAKHWSMAATIADALGCGDFEPREDGARRAAKAEDEKEGRADG